MVEEMAKLDIEESEGFYSAFINGERISKNKPICISKTVLSIDCHKKYILQAIGIPEDSVALSKEEYEKFLKVNSELAVLEKSIPAIKQQERKKTAKEILKILQGYNCDGEIDELITVIGKHYGVEEDIKIIENLLADLRKYHKQMDNNFDMLLIADVVDSAIRNIEYYLEEDFNK